MKLLKLILVILFLTVSAVALRENAECPYDGVLSAWTRATKTTYKDGKQIVWCEYAHGAALGQEAHKFWAECGD
jgi:hypothetical protein